MQLLSRIETCVAKLTPEQIWSRGAESENAVGNLLLHLSGNVRQWIISGVGGAEDRRDRNSEFNAKDGENILAQLRSTVEEAVSLIDSLPVVRLNEQVRPQKYEVTVLGAIYHVVEHFSMHTGQIIFATKLLTGQDLGFYAHLRSARAGGEKLP